MLLRALVDRHRSNEGALPPLYKMQTIGYCLDLNSEGEPVAFRQVPKDERMKIAIPYIDRSGYSNPMPVDHGGYVFGVSPKPQVNGINTFSEDEKQKAIKKESEYLAERTRTRHRDYMELIERIARETQNTTLDVIVLFLKNNVKDVDLPDDFNPSSFIAIYVNDEYFPADDVFQKWWAENAIPPGNLEPLPCSICGNVASPVETIKVLIDGLGSGGKAFISGGKPSFIRHGLESTSGASICAACANDSHQELNALIADKNHSRRLGDSTFVWWATDGCEVVLNPLFSGEDKQAEAPVGDIIDNIYKGGNQSAPSSARLYAATLGVYAKRVVVRDWIDLSLESALDNIRDWIDKVAIVSENGSHVWHPGILSLLGSLNKESYRASESEKKRDAHLKVQLVQSAIYGVPISSSLFARCLQRIRLNQGEITSERASLIKTYLSSQQERNKMDQVTEKINLDSADTPYLCGRLLAVLGRAAEEAVGANKGFIGRFYSSASSTPATAFPRMLQLYETYTSKLKGSSNTAPAGIAIDKDVLEIMSKITGFPQHFDLIEQGRFALGLFHQRAYNYALMEERRAKSKAKIVDPEPVEVNES